MYVGAVVCRLEWACVGDNGWGLRSQPPPPVLFGDVAPVVMVAVVGVAIVVCVLLVWLC